MPFIYTDGEDEEVSTSEGEILEAAGLIDPHPGAGWDGITTEDYKLSATAGWSAVRRVLDRLRVKP